MDREILRGYVQGGGGVPKLFWEKFKQICVYNVQIYIYILILFSTSTAEHKKIKITSGSLGPIFCWILCKEFFLISLKFNSGFLSTVFLSFLHFPKECLPLFSAFQHFG